MSEIREILQSELRPKEKLATLVEAVTQKKITAKEFIEYFKSASNMEKGTCADAMKHISKERPEILAPYIDELIGYINCDVPRVKWGIPEAIGNLSKKYPKEVKRAIPKLIVNTKDKSTVIRWCAAYGLTEIAKNNVKSRKDLMTLFESMIKKESNNGVRNVYIKAIKFIEKNK
jgi:hypothetical protein